MTERIGNLSVDERKLLIASNDAQSDRHALHRAMATIWAMRLEANRDELERIRSEVYARPAKPISVEESQRLPEPTIKALEVELTVCRLPQAHILQRVTRTKSDRKRVRSTIPARPDTYGMARLPSLPKRSEYADIDDAIGRDMRKLLQLRFPRNWRDTVSLAFIARKLKPHLTLQAQVNYVARRFIIERNGARLRNGRIVRIARTNAELVLLGKLIISRNEARAKQLRIETTIDGTREAAWAEIRAILGDALFSALESCDSVTEAVALASKNDGRGPATHWRNIAKVRARIIRP